MLVLIAVFCVLPAAAYAHPGKTDKYGGHQCLKDCEEWRLYYEEYHLHDKDWKPIRVSRKKNAAVPAEIRSAAAQTVFPTPVTVNTQTVTVYRTVTTDHEEDVFSFNPLLWALVVLLLLLLILRRTRQKTP